MREIENKYPNIALAIRRAPLWIQQRLPLCDSENPQRQEGESRIAYKIRMNLIQRIPRRKTPAYATEMINTKSPKGIPYEKKYHGILEHKIEKYAKLEAKREKRARRNS